MHNPAILYPVFALAGWTALVLLLIPFFRVRAGLRREIVSDDFKYGESAKVPAYVSISNRNYMNLLELPVLFYVVCLMLYMTQLETQMSLSSSTRMLALAWTYVGLRVVHSIIHLSYNAVMHRLTAFALSNVVLIILWILTALQIAHIQV
ncbi:MAPEG family protein [Undibacterium sp. Ren11W]|uniref:MAPEG family protein n=1 Tax=Undibacterium sp. Ren11W TaxID=3413045 RepID=UPI003BEFE8B7